MIIAVCVKHTSITRRFTMPSMFIVGLLFVAISFASVGYAVSANKYKTPIALGGIFQGDDEDEEVAFRVAVDMVNEKELFLDYELVPVPKLVPVNDIDSFPGLQSIVADNPFGALETACSILNQGVVGIITSLNEDNANAVQSLCDMKEIPLIKTRYSTEIDQECCFVNLHPYPPMLATAFVDIVAEWKWKGFTILYENEEGLPRIAPLLKVSRQTGFTVVVRPLDQENTGNYRATLKQVWLSGETNFILDCSIKSLDEILKQAQQVGLITNKYNFIIINLDMHTIDLSPFQYGVTNITGIRLINPTDPYVQSVAERIYDKRKEMGLTNKYADRYMTAWKLQVNVALIVDAVTIFAEALSRVEQFESTTLSCDSHDTWTSGSSVINFIRAMTIEGLTGTVSFNPNSRNDFNLDIMELKEGGITHIGNWNPNSGVNISRIFQKVEDVDHGSLKNKSFTVIIALTDPYAMIKETLVQLEGNDQFEGFGMDLFYELSQMLGFNYTFIVRADKSNGVCVNGTWTGMIGDVINGVADLAITDLTITREREKAVDFTSPFMTLGIQILYKKPSKAPPSFFSFAAPFANEVWLLLGIAFFGVSFSLFIMARLCQAEWNNPYPCIEEPQYLINQLSMKNSLWFAIGSLMQQGSDIAPVAISTRMVAAVWWFFTLIMVASYTANLAAFLTTENANPVFENVNELLEKYESAGITFGAKHNGATAKFFTDLVRKDKSKKSKNPVFEAVGEYMLSHPEAMVKENNDGVKRVIAQNYAFFMESVSIEYVTQRDCNLTSVGTKIDEKGYGIAMRKGSPYRGTLSTAILKLHESGKIQEIKRKWWQERRGGGCMNEDAADETPPLNLTNVGGIFWVSLGGTVLAVLFVFIELCLHIAHKYPKDRHIFIKELKEEINLSFHGSVKPVRQSSDDNHSKCSKDAIGLASIQKHDIVLSTGENLGFE